MSQIDRRRELAAIHIAAQQLGLDREAYEAMIYTVAGPSSLRDGKISAAHLDHVGRRRVLEHLKRLGWRRMAPKTAPIARPTPPDDRIRMVRKIRAILAEAHRPQEYADALARRMFGVDRYEWCLPDQMHRLVAALSYDRARRERGRRCDAVRDL